MAWTIGTCRLLDRPQDLFDRSGPRPELGYVGRRALLCVHGAGGELLVSVDELPQLLFVPELPFRLPDLHARGKQYQDEDHQHEEGRHLGPGDVVLAARARGCRYRVEYADIAGLDI